MNSMREIKDQTLENNRRQKEKVELQKYYELRQFEEENRLLEQRRREEEEEKEINRRRPYNGERVRLMTVKLSEPL